MSRKRGLGRGLDALIPSDSRKETSQETPGTIPGLIQISIEAIQPNPHQPRASIDDKALAELAASIQEHGLLQPLVVTRLDQPEAPDVTFQLIAGERRWRAARRAGLDQVPALLKEVAPHEMLELALVENVQRADLNPLEEANAYRQLIDEFGLTQEQVAAQVGKSRTTVANTLRLLRACDAVQQALLSGEVTEGHARALLALESDEAQEAALTAVIKNGLNVRQTESLVRRMAGNRDEPSPPPTPSIHTQRLEAAFREVLGTKVQLQRTQEGRGRVVIHFYSDEELQSIYEQIVGDVE
jgi:ParB family chromosome partitioning protein